MPPSQTPVLSHVSLKVDGSPVPDEAQAALMEITVDRTLHMPAMFMLRLHSPEMKWLDDSTFREGKKVEIFMGEPPVKVLSGKIAVLEPELDTASPTLVVRGYDLFHKLYRGRHRRSFVQVTDADLVKKLAGESQLNPGTIDSTVEVHEYVFQNNQTNAEFLLERARRIGYELWVEDDRLHFRKPAAQGTPIRLHWGEELQNLKARMSTVEQVNEVEVRGWDPKQKRDIAGTAKNGQGAAEIGVTDGAGLAKGAWGEAKLAVVDQYVRSPAEAEKIAQATLDEACAGFVEAEGDCSANADIVPGRQVDIEGVGDRFKGKYYVTQVIHAWSKAGGWTTHFVASGRRDRGLWSLLEEPRAQAAPIGLVIGIVTNNKDPEELGRVRVKFPWLSAQDESAWARVVTPMAGNGRGFFYLPEVDDEVLVGFEQGDIHRPFIMGALWNGKDKTPVKAADAVGGDGKVNKRVLKSRSGHTITLDDTSGGEEITIVDKTGANKIVFHSPDNSLQIKTQGNLTIESQGKITLKAQSGVDMSSQAGFNISGQSGVEVKSQASLKLSGQSAAELSSSASVKVSGGMNAELSGGAQASVKGNAMVEVQGGVIKLN